LAKRTHRFILSGAPGLPKLGTLALRTRVFRAAAA
jgi:hypothetical protein